ncbi:hypothetical protein ONZ45_g9894 [Pleurotus djamor]|nr:hypothetical protein ONZ45_g9894 [Pleurotus djamor]
MQVGNGNFAFGADVTGLQTFKPFAIMSSWGWKNDSLPLGKTMRDAENYRGTSWDNHGRPVQYDFNGGDPAIEQWLISNPNRVNLGRFGLIFRNRDGSVVEVTESDLVNTAQKVDMWTGTMSSGFEWEGRRITVTTVSHQQEDCIGISIESDLLKSGQLGVFIDFPWNDGKAKFSAPFVGRWDLPGNHSTELLHGTGHSRIAAEITHTMDSTTFLTTLGGDQFSVTRDSEVAHRYTLTPSTKRSKTFSFVIGFGLSRRRVLPSYNDIRGSSKSAWEDYWLKSGFVDIVTGSTDQRAEELQRRVILSRYLMRVNEAGDTPPQESGLVNNGWYGKFHMEMFFWHSAHWALWNNWDLLHRSSRVYARFLRSSIARAQVQQHWDAGARWPKMTDPSGRSAPGEINNLLIWEQPHPLVFAEYEYRAFPTRGTLEKWVDVVRATADWMADFAFFNETTARFDLGPPMYVVSEDTNPNATRNAAFELAYWDLGLTIARTWLERMDEEVPMNDGTYSVYEGIEPAFWDDPAFTNDHPALVGLYGWLPKTVGVDIGIAEATTEKAWSHWNISNCWGIGQPEKAVEWLLHPLFQFDDVGMPIGGPSWREVGKAATMTHQDFPETGGALVLKESTQPYDLRGDYSG